MVINNFSWKLSPGQAHQRKEGHHWPGEQQQLILAADYGGLRLTHGCDLNDIIKELKYYFQSSPISLLSKSY